MQPSGTARVEDYTDPYLGTYTTAPAAGPGVCAICHRPTGAGWQNCYSCNRTTAQVSMPTRLIVPISLYAIPGQLHSVLRGYKDSPDSEVRSRHSTQVAAMVGRFFQRHRSCIETKAGLEIDILTVVPSTRSREGHHPLEAALRRVVGLRPLLRPLLTRGTGAVAHVQADPHAYIASAEAQGRRILLVDDTFTTGARIQSAAHALAAAGATVVGALVVGRVIDPDYDDDSRAFWKSARGCRFSFDTCCLE